MSTLDSIEHVPPHTPAPEGFPAVYHCPEGVRTPAATLEWLRDEQQAVERRLGTHGAVLFRGFPLVSADDFDAFVTAFGYPPFTYGDSLSNAVRINHTERVFTANEAPGDVEIFLHHEMAQTPLSPSRLFFFCASSAERGGATPLCRSDQLFAALQAQHPDVARQFSEKGLRYITTMPAEDDPASGQGRSWRSTLSVRDRDEAETKLRALGYDWSWLDGEALRAISPPLPAIRELPDGSVSFYNQLIAAYEGWHGVREDPHSALRFGDHSPISVETLALIAGLAPAFTVDVAWRDGDVVLVDNHRVMHGRRRYAGDRLRQVLVAMAL